MYTEEGKHTLPDGYKVYTKTWRAEPPRAILAFIHGFSDHCNAYYDLFPTLASSGIEVRAFDQRGWGRTVQTPEDRGNTGTTQVVLADIHSFLQSITQQQQQQQTIPIPLVLMGHSMGGGQVLTYTLHPDSPYADKTISLAGVLAYSPLIALDPAYRPSKVYLTGGRLAARVFPRWQRLSPIDPALMSRDESVVADYAADPLCHDIGTLEGLAGMLRRAEWLENMHGDSGLGTEALKSRLLPMWFAHGEADGVTSWAATKRFVDGLRRRGLVDVEFVSYEGAYHNLHADLLETKSRFVRDLVQWVLDRSRVSVDVDAGVEGRKGTVVEYKAKL